MNTKTFLTASLALLLTVVSAQAQRKEPASGATKAAAAAPVPAKAAVAPQKDDSAAELAAIRATSAAFTAAFNKGNAKAITALWTEDGDYIDDAGTIFVGRPAIEKVYADYFSANPNATIRIVIDNLRLLSDTVAVEEGHCMVDPAPAGAPAIGKYTVVHTKVGDQWLMRTVRDTRVETPSTYRRVVDLQWLIGTWTAEEHGAKSESVCRWVANKSFVQRDYTVTHPDGTTISGVQLIGWDPASGNIQSWNFSSDGGHAVGVWSPRPNGWSAEVLGVTGDGTPTASVNMLTRLDDNAYTWQSVKRIIGGQPQPDTDEVVLRRTAASH